MTTRPYDLRVNGRDTPQEVDTERVTLTWKLDGTEAPDAWRVRVMSDAGTDVADSGWLTCSEPRFVLDRAQLTATSGYTWTVATRASQHDHESRSGFHTGLQPAGWQASWIGRTREPHDEIVEPGTVPTTLNGRTWRTMHMEPPLQLRRTFTVDGDVRHGHLFLTARGIYAATINGLRVGTDELAPGWTSYSHRHPYAGFDVTSLLRRGENVICVEVADGWWSGYVGFDGRHHAHHYGDSPELLAQLHVTSASGKQIVVSDGSWRESPGRRVYADLLMGERWDERRATKGWQSAGFDDSSWRNAEVRDTSVDNLIGQVPTPVRTVSELAPTSIRWRDGTAVVDFGQNISGRVRLSLPHTRAGQMIRLRHAEVLGADGDIYTENLRTAEATDIITSAGGALTFEPTFTFHGFRYVEISGLDDELSTAEIRAVAITSAPARADLQTGNPLVNRLQSNIVWGMRGNFVSLPTDCPQRDERLGWTADAHVFAGTAMVNGDVESFFGNWLDDMACDQRPNGSVPDVIPRSPALTAFDFGAPGWGDAAVLVPWRLYRETGDVAILGRYWPLMEGWVRYVQSRASDGVWRAGRGNDYGDWLSVDETTDKALLATAFHARTARILSAAALVLRRDEDAHAWGRYADHVATSFQSAYLTPDGERLVSDTQTAYLLTLAWNLAPSDRRHALGRRLANKVAERGDRLTSGFLGVGLVCPTLDDLGYTDLALRVLLQERYPSWGYSIANGATTIWERWDGIRPDGCFQNVEMNSFNHYSLGAVGEWMIRRIGGIAQTEHSVGYCELEIAPIIDARIGGSEAWYESPRGRVEVCWRMRGDGAEVTVSVPPTASAKIALPGIRRTVGAGKHAFRTGVS